MKKLHLHIYILFFTTFSFGMHKDILIQKNYGNIKTMIKTSFYNSSQIENVEIFAKLAEKLCYKLNYRDTVNVEFLQDYESNFYPNLHIIENGDLKTYRMFDLRNIKEKQEDSYSKKNVQYGICFMVSDTKFDIKKNLKILEYSILNKIEKSINKIIFKRDFDDEPEQEIFYYGLTTVQIQNIIDKPDSEQIKETFSSKISFTEHYSQVKGYFENGFYIFKINDLLYKIEDLVYLIEKEQGTFIFNSTDSFVFLSPITKKIESIKLNSSGDYPFYASTFNHLDTSVLVEKGNLLLNRYFSRDWYIFSMAENRIVNKNK